MIKLHFSPMIYCNSVSSCEYCVMLLQFPYNASKPWRRRFDVFTNTPAETSVASLVFTEISTVSSQSPVRNVGKNKQNTKKRQTHQKCACL
ncbi:MAG: hypothetical protein A2161_16435 [Candidatus Schekmanbacteria bacterium RBG_13_48_7]|uniref:Uncharacterized protein n=1 Tax=Candidatus Schekmanbacteria bacterium RBG_13_48_7 TaxID=1817878 RepID=A0A1F7RWS0_9BACT|nr:MAG: hypothetical protein A2161_16435 [Candidatus Schekmanbacteria bacterium RBG_13_48_7]